MVRWEKNAPLKIILVSSPSDVKKKKKKVLCIVGESWTELSLFVVYFSSVNIRRGLECYVWDIKYNVCSEVGRDNGCILSIDVPHSSPARYKLKRGLFRPAAVQQDTTSAARMELQKMNGHSKDDGYGEGNPK